MMFCNTGFLVTVADISDCLGDGVMDSLIV